MEKKGKGTYVVSFRRFMEGAGPWALEYVRPEKESTKTIPFRIRNVPLR